MASLLPPGDDEFDRGPTAPPDSCSRRSGQLDALESGENTVVFHDGAGGGWFTKRGA